MKHILLTSVAAAMVLTSTASFAADSNRSSKNRVKSERSYNQRNDDARYARAETSAGRNNTMWDNQYPANWNRSKMRAWDSSASAMKRDAYSIEPNDSGVGTEEASMHPRHNATQN